MEAFAAVAAALGDFEPSDKESVKRFYAETLATYHPKVPALVSDFLIGHTGMPLPEDIARLKSYVDGPLSEGPELEAPAWPGEPLR